jgi:hypothetical protein
LQSDLAPSKDNLLDLSLSYDTITRVTTFEAGSGNYLFLLDAFSSAITTATGLKLPATTSPRSDMATAALKASVSDAKGLQYLNVALGGVLSIGGLARRFGFQWSLPDDLVTVLNPKVEFDAEARSLAVDLVVGIPMAGISNAHATLFLSSSVVTLQVSSRVLGVLGLGLGFC